ncbi:MAG: hypothetical protein KDA80_11885, partial [Planctomycetaceae bacterium]|nr:hypothetical protein [Planctomycetaceae bacterium]
KVSRREKLDWVGHSSILKNEITTNGEICEYENFPGLSKLDTQTVRPIKGLVGTSTSPGRSQSLRRQIVSVLR